MHRSNVLNPVAWRAFGLRLLHVSLALLAMAALAPACQAQMLAPAGCPVFHCTLEATGVMSQALVQPGPEVRPNSNNTLGQLKAQGCSGNGSQLACLFSSDNATGTVQGTLKWIDATTLQPYWGTTGAPNSYNLDPLTSAGAQVPLLLADGRIAAGDSHVHVVYDSSGAMLGQVRLTGKGSNYGLTPISDTLGIVSQNDGVLTLIDMTRWTTVGKPLILADAITKARVNLASPSSASISPSSAAGSVLYAVGFNPLAAPNAPGSGYLFSVVLNANKDGLVQRSQLTYDGETGASPVIVSKTISGSPANLILLHVPGWKGDGQDHLLGLYDVPLASTPFPVAWHIDLNQPLKVAPTIDATTHSLFLEFKANPRIYQYDFLTGTRLAVFDLRLLGGLPSDFVFNGHLGASQTGRDFTMLLSGSVSQTQGQVGQYMIAFRPTVNPPSVLWSKQISTVPDQFTAAWNLGPSSQANVFCPIVVGSDNGITRVCDF